jgi:hypothetical protein
MRSVSLTSVALAAALALLFTNAFAGDVALSSPKWELTYHSVVPMGEDALLLQPANRALFFLASAASTGFEGWRRSADSTGNTILAVDGSPVEHYPRFIDFRVTVSARANAIPGLQPLLVDCESLQDLNEYLLNLRFRLKIFRGLEVTVVEPKMVKLVGMPMDIRYDERIYRLSFDLGEVPLADRIVLEVLSPSEERLTRFHLDM